MIDVALMRDLDPIPGIFTVASHVVEGKLDLSPSVPQRSRQKVCWRWRSLQANTPARALDVQRGCKQPTTQRNRSNWSRDRQSWCGARSWLNRLLNYSRKNPWGRSTWRVF
jgi:hypothetical protein